MSSTLHFDEHQCDSQRLGLGLQGRYQLNSSTALFAEYVRQREYADDATEVAAELVTLPGIDFELQGYISSKLVLWAEKHGIRLEHIQPGNPQQNAYVERYNRTVRYDWLGHYLFDSIAKVQEHATRWVWTYNNERPNMALGGITPKQKLALAV